jgi:hypothetical protein
VYISTVQEGFLATITQYHHHNFFKAKSHHPNFHLSLFKMVSIKMITLNSLLAFAAVIVANPVPEPEALDARAVNCGVVNVALVSSVLDTRQYQC